MSCLCLFAALLFASCTELTERPGLMGGNGGNGGVGGDGDGGAGGVGGERSKLGCANPENEGSDCANGTGICDNGVCVDGVFACDDQGLRDAIAVGGGPHTFDCRRSMRVGTGVPFVIDKNVVLDAGGSITADGNESDSVFVVEDGVTAELRGFVVTGGAGRTGLAIQNQGTLTMVDCVVNENSQQSGLFSDRFSIIMNGGTLTMVSCEVSDNRFSGSFRSDNLPAAILNTGTLVIADSVFSDNTAILVVNDGLMTMTGARLTGGRMGGIENGLSGTSTVTTSTLSDSTGAAIDNAGTLSLDASTVSANDGQPGPSVINSGTLLISNSTVSGNAEYDGNAIVNDGTLNVLQSTIVQSITNAGEMTFRGSLIDGTCDGSGTSLGYNIGTPGSGCGLTEATDREGLPVGLGPLSNNGGPTTTHLPLPGSVAIDAIPQAECIDVDEAPLTFDQRGIERPQGESCDIGSVELEQPAD